MTDARPPVPTITSDGGVRWLLGGLLLRKLSSIAKSLLANELDLRDWMTANDAPSYRKDRAEVWFDFIADTGDDPYVMQQLALAIGRPYAADALQLPAQEGPPSRAHPLLPTGEFLLLGGDTAYVTPDEITLRHRIVEPFNAAHASLQSAPRPIYAIPGNHDYYDALVGFNRMFRRPYKATSSHTVLPLDGYAPDQEATYLKLELPGEWELWAVDIGPHGLDYRQHKYFRPDDGTPPRKLIVCTHAPAIFSDRLSLSEIEQQGYERLLGAPPVFMPPAKTDDTFRLFLAGHVHHYARYDGQRDGASEPTSIATIVAGAGGSFIHPTEHRCGDLDAAAKYPTVESSRKVTAAAVTSPVKIIDGGYLWVLGFLLATVMHWGWPDHRDHLGPPLAWLITVVSSVGVVVGGIAATQLIARYRNRAAKQARITRHVHFYPLGRRLIGAIIPASILLALAIPFMAHQLVPQMHPLDPIAVWMVLALVVVGGSAAIGAVAGGPPHPIMFALIGVVHGALQVVLPYLIMRRGWVALLIVLAIWLAFGAIGRWLYRKRAAAGLLVWWLVQGAGLAIALHFIPMFEDRVHGWDRWLLVALAGSIAMPLQFGHYLLAVSAWGGHCNEAGITARSLNYKQFIRFHVTPTCLTGYVIGLDQPNAAPRLVDVFRVGEKAQAEGGG